MQRRIPNVARSDFVRNTDVREVSQSCANAARDYTVFGYIAKTVLLLACFMNGEGLNSERRPPTTWLHYISDTKHSPAKHSTVLKNDLSAGRTLRPTRLRAAAAAADDDDDASFGQKSAGFIRRRQMK